MPTTAQRLYDSCVKGEPLSYPVLIDYFGNAWHSENEDDISIVFGVYMGLIHQGVSQKLLHNCLLTNRLNELVHAKHKYHSGYYYTAFCHKKLDLTDRFPVGTLPKEDWMVIYDDDHCPRCNTKGYLTQGKRKTVSNDTVPSWSCSECCP